MSLYDMVDIPYTSSLHLLLFSLQPLESLSWQHEGLKFVSSHADSSIYFWNTASNSPEEGPTRHYGEPATQ